VDDQQLNMDASPSPMKADTIVAIHQPNYLPWLGFFDKANKADVLILLDNVQYPKRSWSNRVHIKCPAGSAWLTVPVTVKGRYHQLIAEAEINYQDNWVGKHLATLERTYRALPFYEETMGPIKALLEQRPGHLSALNEAMIRSLCESLEIDTEVISGSDLDVSGASTELLIGLTKAVGGSTYLSGEGGRLYQENQLYEAADVALRFQDFQHPEYEQPFQPFLTGLSIFDVLCCTGLAQTRHMLRYSEERFVAQSAETRPLSV